MKDHEFIRDNIPMTKEEIRAIVIEKLELSPRDCLLDIGAGTGSVSVEAALKMPGGKVIVMEQNEKAIALIGKNRDKFHLKNIKIIHSKAPSGMPDLQSIKKIFIGGSGGELIHILQKIENDSPANCMIVITAITMKTIMNAYNFFSTNPHFSYEVIQVSVNTVAFDRKSDMLLARNPIFIITAKKH